MNNRSSCIGIDGCSVGWVAVSRTGAWVDKSLEALLAMLAPDIVAVDMPIGLADSSARACDRAARRLLGRPRGSSVFPTPTRAALAGRSHTEASDLNAGVSGKRISAQAYNLLPKIREVDALVTTSSHWRERVFETHPEVCFAQMNNGAAIIESKKTGSGRAKRQELVAALFGATAYPGARTALRRRDAADDDIADAFACLFTAERIMRCEHVTLPESPEFDSRELPMRIVY